MKEPLTRAGMRKPARFRRLRISTEISRCPSETWRDGAQSCCQHFGGSCCHRACRSTTHSICKVSDQKRNVCSFLLRLPLDGLPRVGEGLELSRGLQSTSGQGFWELQPGPGGFGGVVLQSAFCNNEHLVFPPLSTPLIPSLHPSPPFLW